MLNKLNGLEDLVHKTIAEWNVPGIGIAVVHEADLIWAKGYGFRDYGARLPFTPQTLFPIASNTKLFTAIVAGMLVEEGMLSWDRPIREAVPSIRFSNDALNSTVTLRDMLAHRTGINRHDSMHFYSDFTRKDMFDRLRYMEPSDPLRQNFVYNNVMYCAVGHVLELLTGQSWEGLVQQRLLGPAGMANTVFTMREVLATEDHAVPYTERRDATELFRLPTYEHMLGAGPAGGLNANLQDMARWLFVLLADGQAQGQQIIPQTVLKATMAPSVAIPCHMLNIRGFKELLNTTYGAGRHTGVYRGNLMTYHGGSLNGFYSQVSYLPTERVGVVTFVIGHHCAVLADLLTWNIYDRLLNLAPVPWSERYLPIIAKAKASATASRSKAASDQVMNTNPSHGLADYCGTFTHALYPPLTIELHEGALRLMFRAFALALNHVHYDRFDTEDEQVHGKWSVNFSTDPQGHIGALTMTLDEAEQVFKRCPELLDPAIAALLPGIYETASGFKCTVVQGSGKDLYFVEPGQIDRPLTLYRDLEFRSPSVSNLVYRFSVKDGAVTDLTLKAPSGVYVLTRV